MVAAYRRLKNHGCSIIFINSTNQILLLLRDDIPEIPFPGMWDLPGGHMETKETPDQCIRREILEEMGIGLTDFKLFDVFDMADRVEHTFWQQADFVVDDIDLKEGQRIAWFSENDLDGLELAYGFKSIVTEFFNCEPWRKEG